MSAAVKIVCMNRPQRISSAEYNRRGQDRRTLATRVGRSEIVRVRCGHCVSAAQWMKPAAKDCYGLRALAFTQLSTHEPVLRPAGAALLSGLWIVGTLKKLHAVTETTALFLSLTSSPQRWNSSTSSPLPAVSPTVSQACGRWAPTTRSTSSRAPAHLRLARCRSGVRMFRKGRISRLKNCGWQLQRRPPVLQEPFHAQ